MVWFWQHGQQLLILFVFPLIGLALDFMAGKKKIVYTLGASGVLLSPALTGYSYIVDWAYTVLALVALSCVYALFSKQIESRMPKVISAIVISSVLLVALGWGAFMNAFMGFQLIENRWETKGYRVEYIRDQGFAGRPLMKYELSRYGVLPIFIKRIDTAVDSDTTQNCHVNFVNSNLVFDKCSGTLNERL
jgi:hypothetical protein